MLKKILLIAQYATIFAGLLVTGYIGHREGVKDGVASVPHIVAINPATGKLEPIPTVGKDVQIIVVGPQGMEEGVVMGHTKDGTKVLVMPPSMLSGPDQQAPDAPSGLKATPNHHVVGESPNPLTKLT